MFVLDVPALGCTPREAVHSAHRLPGTSNAPQRVAHSVHRLPGCVGVTHQVVRSPDAPKTLLYALARVSEARPSGASNAFFSRASGADYPHAKVASGASDQNSILAHLLPSVRNTTSKPAKRNLGGETRPPLMYL